LLDRHAVAKNVSSPSAFWDWIQAYCYILVLLQIKLSSFICLYFLFVLYASFGLCNLSGLDCAIIDCNSNKNEDLDVLRYDVT
jgi:hypothetical protein